MSFAAEVEKLRSAIAAFADHAGVQAVTDEGLMDKRDQVRIRHVKHLLCTTEQHVTWLLQWDRDRIPLLFEDTFFPRSADGISLGKSGETRRTLCPDSLTAGDLHTEAKPCAVQVL